MIRVCDFYIGRFFFVFCISFLLGGCENFQSPEVVIPILTVPDFQVLTNEAGYPLGKAFLAKENIWITPDHIYETNPDLFCAGQKISILVRDFERDLLAFSLEASEPKDVLMLSSTPPAVGKLIYWFDEKLKDSIVESSNAPFQVDRQVKVNLLTFSGVTAPGASGGIVFDENGLVFGMIIGADRNQEKVFAVRADTIAGFVSDVAETNVE